MRDITASKHGGRCVGGGYAREFNKMAYLIGLVLMGFFGWLMSASTKNLHALKKYEFENRTSGGVVQFPNYEDSLKHNKKKSKAGLLFGVGFLGATLGFLIFLMTFLLKNHIH